MRIRGTALATTILLSLLAGASASIAAPPAAAGAAPVAAADPSREVLAAAEAIVAAFGRDDPKTYFALFDPAATFIFHTTPGRLESRASYEAEWAKWAKEDGFHVRACSSAHQRVQLFGDLAIFTHSVRTELSTKQGDSTVHERETIVFERRDGKWIAVHEHLSPDPSTTTP